MILLHDWLFSVSLPTLLGYQRASAFVNATKLASQPLFSSDEEYKISNVLSNTFFIDIDHVSIAIHIVIVLSPSPRQVAGVLDDPLGLSLYTAWCRCPGGREAHLQQCGGQWYIYFIYIKNVYNI